MTERTAIVGLETMFWVVLPDHVPSEGPELEAWIGKQMEGLVQTAFAEGSLRWDVDEIIEEGGDE